MTYTPSSMSSEKNMPVTLLLHGANCVHNLSLVREFKVLDLAQTTKTNWRGYFTSKDTNNKGPDQAVWMHRLICFFDSTLVWKGFIALWFMFHIALHFIASYTFLFSLLFVKILLILAKKATKKKRKQKSLSNNHLRYIMISCYIECCFDNLMMIHLWYTLVIIHSRLSYLIWVIKM